MWPWEHLAVGYICVSLAWRLARGEGPSETATLLLAVGTQLPDLVDKPLSWGLGLFPSGFAVGHALVVAVPVGLAAVVLARRRGHLEYGAAFAIGYWSHLVADVADGVRFGDGIDVGRVLWPFVTHEPYGTDYGLARGWVYLTEFANELPTLDLTSVLVLYLVVPVAGLLLWLADGAPGPRGLYRLAVGSGQ